jgi:hypothetical protein
VRANGVQAQRGGGGKLARMLHAYQQSVAVMHSASLPYLRCYLLLSCTMQHSTHSQGTLLLLLLQPLSTAI